MTDKERIRVEIERLKRKDVYTEYARGCNRALEEILSFIDSMPEEQLTRSVTKTSDQEEPVSENLEKAADYCYYHNHAFARESFVEGARWQRNNVWHDAKKEKPVYDSNIAVIRNPSDDVSMSVCAMVSEDIIYSPVARKEYKWGSCPFTHWAYIEDLLPNGKEE